MPKRPTEIDLNLAVAHGLRPDWFCRDRLGFEPDEWQANLLRSRSRQIILNMGPGRQEHDRCRVGAAYLSLHTRRPRARDRAKPEAKPRAFHQDPLLSAAVGAA